MDHPPLRHTTVKDICLWLLRRYRRFRVTGESMMPILPPSQEVLIDTAAYHHIPPQPGDIVVAYHPLQPKLLIVKRILFVHIDGRCYLKGDNAASSSDSRQFGLVPPEQIAGKVFCLFP